MFYSSLYIVSFFFKSSVAHRDLHVLTHSFPTRRSSDLPDPHLIARFRADCAALWPAGERLSVAVSGGPDSLALLLLAQAARPGRSEEHTSELQSLMRISYAVFCLKKKNKTN